MGAVDYPVRLLVPTGRLEQYRVIQSLTALLNIFAENELHVVLLDNPLDPMTEAVRGAVEKMAPSLVTVRRAAPLRTLADLMPFVGESGDGLTIVCHPDVILTSRRLLDNLVLDRGVDLLVPWMSRVSRFWDGCYAFKNRLVEPLRELSKVPVVASAIPLSALLMAAGGCRWRAVERTLYWDYLVDKYDVTDHRVCGDVNNYDILCFDDVCQRNDDVFDRKEQAQLMCSYATEVALRARRDEHDLFYSGVVEW